MQNVTSGANDRVSKIVSNVIRVLLAIAFLAAAARKLAGVPTMVQVFQNIGLGQGFRYVTAIVEIIGAIALFVPGRIAFAALWLGVTMAFATLAHLFILHSNPGGAVLLFALSITLAWLRRKELPLGSIN
ncbi:DoxX family protein [Sphingomonas sp. PAMC 26617]|uniref:DoxX family protein n=1 Tax=Sphingomonas sp. PAMC 26617 TaxID=1112216 RepID=UPI000569E444|nr:DoxX family protein [Sphingomonas sp. PAMC 26617]